MTRGSRSLALSVGLFLGCLMPNVATACGSLDYACKANRSIDGWLHDKSKVAGEGMVAAFEPIVDRVMTEQVPAIINQVDHAVAKNLISAEEGASRLIKQIQQSLDDSFALAESRAKEFMQKTFQKEVVEALSNSLNGFRDAFFRDLSKTVDHASYEATCITFLAGQTVNRETTYFFDRIDSILDSFSFFRKRTARDQCHEDLSVQPRTYRSDYTVSESFKLWKCALLASHTLETPASTIAAHYADIELRARELMCLHRGGAGVDIYVREWVEAGRIGAVWQVASSK